MQRLTIPTLALAAALTACDEPTQPPARPNTPSALTAGASCPAQGTVIMTDLGPVSNVNDAFAINDRGQVVGHASEGAEGNFSVSFLWTAVDGHRRLGTLGGLGDEAVEGAEDINELGQVVGHSETVAEEVHAFLWTASAGMRDLGTLGGGQSSANGINNSGQVVGASQTASFTRRAFLWTQASGMRDLGTLPGFTDSEATGINGGGEVVGHTVTSQGGLGRAFLWTAARGMRDLGTLPGDRVSGATDINDRGQAVGVSRRSAAGESHAFLWTAAGGMRALGALGGNSSSASAINEQGQVVGGSTTRSGSFHGFVWTPARGMRDLGTLPGSTFSSASDINNRRQIVGTADKDSDGFGGSTAVMWTLIEGRTPAFELRILRALGAETQALVPPGRLTPAQARSLVLKLERAAVQLETRHWPAAVSLLRSYVSDVRALMAGGLLQRADGQRLIDLANCVIDRLS